MSKTIIGAMPIRTVGLTPGHRWCGELRSVKPAVNNGKGARGLVQGLNSLNATYIRQGRIRDRPRKLAKDLRNGHLVQAIGDNDDYGLSVWFFLRDGREESPFSLLRMKYPETWGQIEL